MVCVRHTAMIQPREFVEMVEEGIREAAAMVEEGIPEAAAAA